MSDEISIKDGVQYIESWADFAEKAGLIPQGTTTYQAMAIVQAGKEMGLQPLQSLRSMNFIKGRLVMSVQLQLAIAKNTKNVIVENLEETDDCCKVILKRGEEVIACEYTLEDAKKAGLIKTDGSWIKYQRQMLRWRAIGDALRIICPDLVMGLLSPEEAESIESFAPQKKSSKPLVTAPQTKTEFSSQETDEFISPEQGKRFYTLAKSVGWKDDELKKWLMENYKIDSTKKITRTIYERICEGVIEDKPGINGER